MTKAQYLSWFDEVLRPAEPTFRCVPPDNLDFRLTEKSFSIGQLLSHIPASFSYIAKVLKHEELPLKSLREIMIANRKQPSATIDEGLRYLGKSTSVFKGAVETLSEDEFRGEFLDTPQMGRVMYWRYCAFALEHHIHHFMELHLSLKVLGIDVNTKTLYGG